MDTWTTPLGERLTVAGKGGPWLPIMNHVAAAHRPADRPLKTSLPKGVDAGWYYRNGWQPKSDVLPD